MMFIFFGFYLLLHVLLLSVTVPFMRWCKESFSLSTEFLWLIAFPIVIAVFAVFAGLMCKLKHPTTALHTLLCMYV